MFNETMLSLGKKRSCIRELFEYGLKQAQIVGRENVYDYSLGNPSIPAPPEVNESFIRIIRETDSLAVHGYTPAPGTPDARRAVAEDLNARFGTAIRPENIFFTCGAAPALISVIRALAAPEAEIIGLAPFFPEYRPFVEANGVKFVEVPADYPDFQVNLQALEACITPHTQAVIVNSPNNPSGVVYSREILEKLAALLTRKGEEFSHAIYLIADEPYRELAYDGVEVPFIPTLYPNTVVCYSYSKSLSLPGERIGYLAVSPRMHECSAVYAAVLGAGRALGYINPPSLFQRVIEKTVGAHSDFSQYKLNRDILTAGLREIGYECVDPRGAFYLFAKALEPDAKAFCEHAKKYELLLVPSNDFGMTGYFRMAYCVKREMIGKSMPAFKALWDDYHK